MLVGIVFQQQLGEVEADEGDLRAMADSYTKFKRILIGRKRFGVAADGYETLSKHAIYGYGVSRTISHKDSLTSWCQYGQDGSAHADIRAKDSALKQG